MFSHDILERGGMNDLPWNTPVLLVLVFVLRGGWTGPAGWVIADVWSRKCKKTGLRVAAHPDVDAKLSPGTKEMWWQDLLCARSRSRSSACPLCAGGASRAWRSCPWTAGCLTCPALCGTFPCPTWPSQVGSYLGTRWCSLKPSIERKIMLENVVI